MRHEPERLVCKTHSQYVSTTIIAASECQASRREALMGGTPSAEKDASHSRPSGDATPAKQPLGCAPARTRQTVTHWRPAPPYCGRAGRMQAKPATLERHSSGDYPLSLPVARQAHTAGGSDAAWTGEALPYGVPR